MCATKPHSAGVAATGSLAGATLVLTRPVGSARALAARVRALGGTPLLLPGLSLRVLRDADLAERLRAGARDDWVFTSPAAVRACFALAPDLRLGHRARAFAVGAGTQRALARHGWRALAPQAGADSEALLAMPELAQLRNRRVALVCAPGGRDLIAPALRARAARLAVLHVYERRKPRLTQRHFAALQAAPTPWLSLVSSAQALDNLAALLPPALAHRWRGQVLVVASQRLADLAHERGFSQVAIARSALAADLVEGAIRALARHRL